MNILLLVLLLILPLQTVYAEDTWSILLGTQDVDAGRDIITFKDGSFLLVGREKSNFLLNGVFVKFSPDGTPVWQRRYDTKAGSIIRASDRGFLAVGYGALLKLDGNGNAEWQKSYIGRSSGDVSFSSVVRIRPSSYLAIGGVVYEKGFWLGKLTDQGEIHWERIYSFCSAQTQYGQRAFQTDDGGILYAGTITCPESGSSIIFGKLDAAGAPQWQKEIRTSGFINLSSLQPSNNGNFFLGGDDNQNVFLLKLDSQGNVLKQTNLNLPRFTAIQRLNDGTFLLFGGSRFSKLKANGDVIFIKKFRIGINQHIFAARPVKDGYILTGSALIPNSDTKRIDIWVLRLDENGDLHGADCVEETSEDPRDVEFSSRFRTEQSQQ